MRKLVKISSLIIFSLSVVSLSSCSTYSSKEGGYEQKVSRDYSNRMPSTIATNEKVVIVDPSARAWGAYDKHGTLLRSGLATSGSSYCPDLDRSCRTSVGTFRIYSLGTPECKSHKFPLPRGGAPMPYCMFFNGGQGLHGSYEVVDGNVSHGCVRMHVDDAKWLRYNFASVGTKVVVKSYPIEND